LQEVGMTVVISSHVLSDLAELCTWVGIMELGYLVESAPLQELYKRLSRQQIFMSVLGNKLEALTSALKNFPWVENWAIIRETQQVCVDFSGSPEDAANLLRELVAANIPLTEFHCTQEDLETIFLKMGHQQAS
jgi:ABC-2 type transport system ATP-binding protein